MGKIEKVNGTYVFRQDDGEITAWFDHIDEHMELAHEGRPAYKKFFYLLVSIGVIYLTSILFIN
jgi:hypothetical protein